MTGCVICAAFSILKEAERRNGALKEDEFARFCREAGGKAYIVGGWVRDFLRGAVPKDKDYVVCGLSEETFHELFPSAERVGKSFPVYLVRIDGTKCEVAFARRERKSGNGYRGFDVISSPELTIEEDLYRRDTTMNAVAMELPFCSPGPQPVSWLTTGPVKKLKIFVPQFLAAQSKKERQKSRSFLISSAVPRVKGTLPLNTSSFSGWSCLLM